MFVQSMYMLNSDDTGNEIILITIGFRNSCENSNLFSTLKRLNSFINWLIIFNDYIKNGLEL